MSDKTKATMPGRQCSTENKEHIQLTRPCAGGQSLSNTGIPVSHAASILTVPANTGALNFPQWGELPGIEISADPNVLQWREFYKTFVKLSGANNLHRRWKLPSNQQGYTPAPHTHHEISPILGRLILNRGRNSAYRYPDIGYRYGNSRNAWHLSPKNSFGQIPDIRYHSLSDFLVCSRRSSLSFFRKDSSGNDIGCFCWSPLRVGELFWPLVMIQTFGIQRLYILFLILFSCSLNSFLRSSSSTFNSLYFSEIPCCFISVMANCNSIVSLMSGGNIESEFPVISAAVCLQSPVAGQSHVIPICPAISKTTTSYLSFLLLLSAENLYSMVFLRSGACASIVSVQPFGSIPRFCNSARPSSFSQLARLTPSFFASVSNCSFSSGGIRIWKAGAFPAPFGCLSRLMVIDMCVPIGVLFFLIGTHLNTVSSKKTTPRTVGAVPRRLTPTVNLDNEAAMKDHITHPQGRNNYTWRFLSASERYPTAKPLVIYVNASSEQEARDTMPGVNLIFAARLPFHAFRGMANITIPSGLRESLTPSTVTEIATVQGVNHG